MTVARKEFAEKMTNLAHDYLSSERIRLYKLSSAKKLLNAQGQLTYEECFYCRLSPQEVSDQDKQELVDKYADVRFVGFHCSSEDHTELVH